MKLSRSLPMYLWYPYYFHAFVFLGLLRYHFRASKAWWKGPGWPNSASGSKPQVGLGLVLLLVSRHRGSVWLTWAQEAATDQSLRTFDSSFTIAISWRIHYYLNYLNLYNLIKNFELFRLDLARNEMPRLLDYLRLHWRSFQRFRFKRTLLTFVCVFMFV